MEEGEPERVAPLLNMLLLSAHKTKYAVKQLNQDGKADKLQWQT